MAWDTSPFHRFRGWHIWGLLAVTLIYSYWFTVLGPYAKLSSLGPGLPLEARPFVSRSDVLAALGGLDKSGETAKLISLAADIPYLVLNGLLAEALIGFGIRRWNLRRPVWSLLFVLPLGFVIADLLENLCLALTLTTGSGLTATLAGPLTGLKFLLYSLAGLAGIGLSVSGLIYWLVKGRKQQG